MNDSSIQRVVDACVVAKWFLPEAHKQQAENLLHDFVDEKVNLIAPDILVIEIGSLLWKRSTKIKDISPAEADRIWEEFLALGLPGHPSASLATAAFKLAIQNDHKIYDMLLHSPSTTERVRVRHSRPNADEQIGGNIPLLALARRSLGEK